MKKELQAPPAHYEVGKFYGRALRVCEVAGHGREAAVVAGARAAA